MNRRINISKRDEKLTFKKLWIQDQFQKFRANSEFDSIPDSEIIEFLRKKYSERRIVSGRLYNNTTNNNFVMTQENFINVYLNEPFILSGYGCFYKNQNDAVNISSAALENLGAMRKKYKKKMEESAHGSSKYIYYRVLQLTYKVLMNSYYGIIFNMSLFIII